MAAQNEDRMPFESPVCVTIGDSTKREVKSVHGASEVMIDWPHARRGPQYQATVDALEARLQQLPGVVSTTSLAALSKQAAAGMNEGSLTWYEIPRNQGLLNAIITRAPRELFNQNCDLLTVNVFLADHKADTLNRVVATVEAFAAEHNTQTLQFMSAAGNAGQ